MGLQLALQKLFLTPEQLHNWGWRIDHIMATAPLVESCRACDVDLEPRKSAEASDHTVLWAEFEI